MNLNDGVKVREDSPKTVLNLEGGLDLGKEDFCMMPTAETAVAEYLVGKEVEVRSYNEASYHSRVLFCGTVARVSGNLVHLKKVEGGYAKNVVFLLDQRGLQIWVDDKQPDENPK